MLNLMMLNYKTNKIKKNNKNYRKWNIKMKIQIYDIYDNIMMYVFYLIFKL